MWLLGVRKFLGLLVRYLELSLGRLLTWYGGRYLMTSFDDAFAKFVLSIGPCYLECTLHGSGLSVVISARKAGLVGLNMYFGKYCRRHRECWTMIAGVSTGSSWPGARRGRKSQKVKEGL